MRNRYLYITLLTLLGFNAEATAQAVAQTPRLVVLVTVDQVRTDHLERSYPTYTDDGLRRLLTDGMVYSNGSYPFLPVDMASAVASLATGTTPFYHGVTGREWISRATLLPGSIVNDDQYRVSPQQLGTSTTGDEMKVATDGNSHIYAFALEADRAILSAGHAANGVAWIENGQWQTTGYYTPADKWLASYVRHHKPIGDDNQDLTKIALACTEQMGLGQDDKPDMLSIGYAVAPTTAGYAALDRTIGDLLNGLTRHVPLDRMLFVLTSTGAIEEERREERFRIPTGKLYINRTADLMNLYLGAVFGSAQYIETCYKNQLFLNHKLISQKNIDLGDVLRRAQEFLLQLSGIRNVYTSHQLLTSDNQRLERIRNGFNVEKCGDLLIDVAPGWELVNEYTHQSSTSRANIIPFPIIFYGADIQPQRVTRPVTADRIAPTIARAIRIRAPNACSAEPLF